MIRGISKPTLSNEQLFRRFKRKVSRSGNLGIVRRKRWFVPKSEIKRIKKKKAFQRSRRRQYQPRY